MEKINYKRLFIFIIGTYLIGGFFSFFIDIPNSYQILNKPKFSPPSYIFPIVWIILYTLMGISLYIISYSKNNKNLYIIYIIQLILNSLWTLFYFGLNLKLISIFIIILLIIMVLIMIYTFYKKVKIAGYLQIPYLLWLIFAGYLNILTYILN